ncbi:SRPBCC domain-containing protein [Pseudarthrobacter sp. J75]|uniref:SRPBCC family protein n=1 Tax=unclassified Pseudarthrobacter TaxID=2647000 RepID=UPI002E8122F0|nr:MULTISPECIES: SRPBCC domain-containing protein [unclassified Pseudarthrobacter]MEE2522547.1 SRPBCC domain-containing protein [Pseudarthrobacter sp. J47]MEE2529109.1 SRPBCC domain-containing protein [Pseudarthrobacter sp. J75]
MTNHLSVVINADARQVWEMLREPAKVAQWHGWDAETLPAEIDEIYFGSDVVEAPDHTSVTLHGGDVFELEPVATGTLVKVTRGGVDHDSEWAAWDEDITQGWLTFLQQLRFALERHPHGKRHTLFFDFPDGSGSAIEKLGLAETPKPGEAYELTLATGEEISGKVWYRDQHQVGLTVHSYAEHGDGLLIVADKPVLEDVRPDGGAMVIASTYDLGAHQLESIQSRWDGWRAENYPTSKAAG